MAYPEVDFLYLSEKDMIKAGVTDMSKCIDAMEEVLKCLSIGDFVMGGEKGRGRSQKIYGDAGVYRWSV